VSAFFAYLYRLRFIQRWSLMRNTLPENVAEHSFQVALLTHALCTIAQEVYHREVDTGRAVILALFHDVSEVMTGDIPMPVKHHNPGILANMREMEALASAQLLEMLPQSMASTYAGIVTPSEQDRALLRYVKAADKLDAYLKCAAEVAAGNREFAIAKRQTEQQVRSLALPEVDFFLQHFAPSFEQTLDELAEE
jgi:5'-deoxynucleotidase